MSQSTERSGVTPIAAASEAEVFEQGGLAGSVVSRPVAIISVTAHSVGNLLFTNIHMHSDQLPKELPKH